MKETAETPWHERDDFWEAIEPFIFTSKIIDAASQDVEHAIAMMKLEPGARICDLCCGIGRHSLELARRGFQVTSVDRTEHYLERAKANAKAEGLDIEFVHQDARNFRRPDSFDAVINLFTSFGYFKNPNENITVLENINASLKPGGKVLMELMGKEVLARIFQERDWRQEDNIILLEERKVGKNWEFIEARWILFKDGQKYEQTFSTKLYSAIELIDMFSRSGFRAMETFGGLDGSPYDQKANRLTILGCK
ncbi:MAG: class I SAM-dependent methyltransferase [Sedimentisphaerales bacterium]|nr:class I SAM-dependent methyltransferase [Sedimentisphaerales bacterium]